ncbi:MAG: TolC family protein [Verrucomicrobia bacterium]|nr:TolC family protein [Verrucomicrobiota bacterium]
MQNTLRFFLGCLTAAFLLQFSQLQAQERLSLSKETAVALALRNNKSLTAAKTTIEQALARHSQAGKLSNPELKIDYAFDKAFNNEGEYSFGFGFEQRFPVNSRLRHLKTIAQIEIALAEAEISNQERLLTQQVETVILNIAQAEEQIRLRESQIRLNEEFARFVESRVRAAEASMLEVNQVRLELFSVKQQIEQLNIERKEYLSLLKRLLGLEESRLVEVLYEFNIPETPVELPLVTATAIENHPEYRLKKLLFEIADKHTSLQLANRWDDIAVGLFFENERSVDEPVGRRTDNFFGVSVSIPLPFNNRNEGRVQESRAYQRQIELELEAVSLNTRSLSHSLKEKVGSLYKQVYEYDHGVTQIVEQNLKDMNVAYESGLVSLTDLFRSQEQRLKIEFFQLTMLHDYEQALVDWKAATNQDANRS